MSRTPRIARAVAHALVRPRRRAGLGYVARVVKSLALSWFLLTWVSWTGSALAAEEPQRKFTTADIARESQRTVLVENRVVNFWWLPLEYWVAAARELGLDEKTQGEVRTVFREYLLFTAIDAEIKPEGGFEPRTTLEIVRRAQIELDGRPLEVLREVSPRLQELVPQLLYVMQASLGPMAKGLHVLPLRGIDDRGNVIMSGVVRGRLRMVYQAAAKGEPLEFYWRAPMTAVVGPKQCPGTGETMEAHWIFCPWSGQRVP